MRIYAFVLACIACVVDQATKWYIIWRRPYWSCEIFGIKFDTQIVYNKGIVFGCAKDISPRIYIIFLSILLLWVMLMIVQSRSPIFCWALCLGGGLGNMLDRVFHGHVIDFLRLHVCGFTFPWVFNFADICICFAAMIFVIQMLWKRQG